MITLEQNYVESEIIKLVSEISTSLEIETVVDNICCPSNIGISSQILITVMSRLESALGVVIPKSCYIFLDNKSHTQLNIQEAAKKLIKFAKNGK